jgi:hypothetical protein
MHVPGPMVHIEHLVGLSHGAQLRVVTSLAFLLLREFP